MATTNLGLILPTVDGSANDWGTELNTALTALDALFAAAGTGTSVGFNVGAGKTLTVAGTINVTGTANIDHDGLTNFVANEHVDHSAVTFTAGGALTGGGDLTTSRNITLDINGLTEDTDPDEAADFIITYDVSGVAHKKVLISNISHDGLGDFVANEHIDHSAVSISAGEGLSGGGTIAANRALALDVSGLTAETSIDENNDYVVVYDTTAAAHRKVSPANLPSVVDQHMVARAVEKTVSLTVDVNVMGRIYAPPGLSADIIAVEAHVDTAGTTGTTTVDVHKNGTTIFSSALSIASGGLSSTGGTLDGSQTFADGDYLEVDVDAITTTPPQGLQVTMQLRATY